MWQPLSEGAINSRNGTQKLLGRLQVAILRWAVHESLDVMDSCANTSKNMRHEYEILSYVGAFTRAALVKEHQSSHNSIPEIAAQNPWQRANILVFFGS